MTEVHSQDIVLVYDLPGHESVARNSFFMFHIPLQIALQALIETTTKVWDVFDRRKKEALILRGVAGPEKGPRWTLGATGDSREEPSRAGRVNAKNLRSV